MKKRNVLFIVIAIVFAIFFVSITESGVPKSTPTVKEEAVEEELVEEVRVEKNKEPVAEPEGAEEKTEAAEVVSNDKSESVDMADYFEVGETYDNGELSITALEIGFYKNSTQLAYVLTDIENISDEEQTVYQDNVIYIDDYQYGSYTDAIISSVEEVTELDGMDGSVGDVRLNPGRKCKYVYYVGLPEDAQNANKVEFVIYDSIPVLLKNNGNWLYGNDSDGQTNTTSFSSGGIGNPIIDANPDRYIPEGITGEIDAIDGTFYTDQAAGFTPGEYLMVGGGNGVINISEDHKFSLSFISNEVDFNDAEMEELINCDEACSYQVYGNDTGYVVSFFNNGLYLYTDHVDDENDWAEGFYEISN